MTHDVLVIMLLCSPEDSPVRRRSDNLWSHRTFIESECHSGRALFLCEVDVKHKYRYLGELPDPLCMFNYRRFAFSLSRRAISMTNLFICCGFCKETIAPMRDYLRCPEAHDYVYLLICCVSQRQRNSTAISIVHGVMVFICALDSRKEIEQSWSGLGVVNRICFAVTLTDSSGDAQQQNRKHGL